MTNIFHVQEMDSSNISTDLSTEPLFHLTDAYENLPAAKLANFIWRVASILLVVFGTIGNAISFLVMSRPKIRKTVTSLLLRALAVVDTSVLWTGYFVDWILIVLQYDMRLMSEIGCQLQIMLFYWTFHYSAWILVLVTIERFISVVFPLKARKIVTKKSMMIAMGLIGLFLFVLSSHFFWTQKLEESYGGGWVCINNVNIYNVWLSTIWPWIDLTIYSIIPFLIICTSNIAILTKVLISRRKITSSTSANTATNTSTEKSSQLTSMTTTLVCVSVIFLITTLPYPFYVLVKTYSPHTEIDINTQTKQDLAWAVVNFAAYANNAMNFPLYCLSSRFFRAELVSMVCKKKVGPIPAADNTEG